MAQQFAGNIPAASEGWRQVGECEGDAGTTWMIFAKPEPQSEEWVVVKVAVKGRVTRKANYWLAKNIRTGKVARSRDCGIMVINRPVLYKNMVEVLKGLEQTE